LNNRIPIQQQQQPQQQQQQPEPEAVQTPSQKVFSELCAILGLCHWNRASSYEQVSTECKYLGSDITLRDHDDHDDVSLAAAAAAATKSGQVTQVDDQSLFAQQVKSRFDL
jgi:hypothetical protein